MILYIIKRLLQMIPIVLGVSLIVFLMMSLSPGDPARMILGLTAEEAAVEQLREELGLNEPLVVQYFNYISRAVVGDFGTSFTTRQSVSEMIAIRLPATLILSFGSLFVIMAVAVPLGIALAVKQNSLFDNVMRVVSLIMAAMPGFWLGLLLILLFAVHLNWLPSHGLDSADALILPILCLSVSGWAINSRMTRASMLDVIRQDYIRTARAKGLSEKIVIRRHALRNALMPNITLVGMMLGNSLGGSVIIETLFGINGMGNMMVAALRQKDIPTVLSGVIITAIVIAMANLITDLAYAFVDPRIKSRYIKQKKAEATT